MRLKKLLRNLFWGKLFEKRFSPNPFQKLLNMARGGRGNNDIYMKLKNNLHSPPRLWPHGEKSFEKVWEHFFLKKGFQKQFCNDLPKLNAFGLIVIILTLLIMVPQAIISAKPSELNQVLAGMQRRYEATQTYKTEFRQTLTSEAFKKVIREASGVIYFEKPGRIKWEYLTPDKHVYLLDGEIFWDYDEAQKQVIKIPIKDALPGSVPEGFLFGAGNFKKDFEIKLMGHQENQPHKGYALSLTPRDKDMRASMSNIEFLVDDQDYAILETRFTDPQGNVNNYTFSNTVLNPKLDPAMFIFAIPEGVKIILPAMPSEMPKHR